MKKLYVGNMSYSTNESALREFFADFGPVSSVKIITDFESKQSRGFGFIELEDSDRADSAISMLNGKELDGKALKINEARPQAEGMGRPMRGSQSYGNSRNGNRSGYGGGSGRGNIW